MARHRYKQAFIKSPKLNFRLLEIVKISGSIALLKALGEGSLCVSTKRRPADGYYSMAECAIRDLLGKTEAEIFEILDERTDKVIELERQRLASKGD